MQENARSESVEMYLKTLAELGLGQEPVPIARVAERLGVTQVSASEMMQRLGKQDLVAHTPYKGVALTPDGRQLANNVIRRQRLWECFLANHLKLAWSRVYDLACALEHATSPEVTESLDAYLGHPTLCPHGNPIPDVNGKVEPVSGVPLSALAVGQAARILAVQESAPDVLDYLQKRSLLPGQTIRVEEAAPLQGPLTLRLGDDEIALGLNLAAMIQVEPLSSTMPLSELRPGQRATIVHVGGHGPIRRRYMEMGIVKGETVRVERVAPLGDPVEYFVKGYHLSLRREEAGQIMVETGDFGSL
ncbi:MAG TPA: metal-dependent transcriptional regulator [Anaerolineae bacterium]|nr:metal-dependent transcriptional regulator [Anaerolineae bacterium]